MSPLYRQALPPISVSLVKTGSQLELRGSFQAVHLKPTDLLVVPVQLYQGAWYHVGPKNQLQRHQQISAGDIPATAQLRDLHQLRDIIFTDTSFELKGTGLQSIIDHMQQRTGLPQGAHWLLLLLHSQITTDIKDNTGLEMAIMPAIPHAPGTRPVHVWVANLLEQQHQPSMQGRISDGLLNWP